MNINRKKILYKILIYIIIFLITFLLLILIYDFFFKNKYIYNINNFYHAVPNTVENYQNDDQRLKGKKKIKITNDEYGFRNNLKILETDILFLGDSLIRATNTSDKYLLSNSFNEKVYNAGMDGFSTYNSVEVAKFLLKKKKFKKIFLFFNLNNDFRDNIYQIRYNNNLKDKFFIFLKNTSFFYELIKLKNLIYYENIITFK